MTTEFWIGIVFWCMGKDCGMITTRYTFASKQDCLVVVNKMVSNLQQEPTKKDIVDGRCSDHSITFDKKYDFNT